MRILVTGGAGFIGSHVSEKALAQGHTVSIVDNLTSGKMGNVPSGALFIEQDIKTCDWDNYLNGVDVVVHCAAFVSAPESFIKFDQCYDTNVIATWKLIQACCKNVVKKILFCSSSAIYAESLQPNFEEEYPQPANPYGLTKLDVEYLLSMAKKEYNLNYTALRYFNVYGPRQDINSEYSAVIPIFITRALKNADLIIYGDGKQRRDFINVSDVAEAVIAFAKADITGFYNVGTGKDYSLLELADIIIKETHSSSKILYETARPGDVNFSTASLQKQIGAKIWEPKIGFQDGIQQAISFYKRNPHF